jgi:hypothetical protein
VSAGCVLQFPPVGRFHLDYPRLRARSPPHSAVFHLPSSEIADKFGILAEEKALGPQWHSIAATVRVAHPAVQAETTRLLGRFTTLRSELAAFGKQSDRELDVAAFRRVRDEAIPDWTSMLYAVGPRDLVNAEGRLLFRQVRSVLERHYYLSEPWQYVVTTLFVLQAHVVARLPRVFYLYLAGTYGTGKTEFESRIAQLTNGIRLVDFSLAYLARALRPGAVAILDEWGSTGSAEQEASKSALIRSGYKADAPPYSRIDGRSGKPLEFPVFGPKMIAYRGKLDDALQSRGFSIPTVKPKGEPGYDLVLANMWPKVGDLQVRLAAWGASACAEYSSDRLEAIAYTAEFRTKVRESVEELGANRDSELVTIALLVGEMAGLDVRAELLAAGELRKASVADAESEDLPALADSIRETLAAFPKTLDGEPTFIRIRQKAVKDALNRKRSSVGERPVGGKEFASLRRTIGVADGWLRVANGHALSWTLPMNFLEQLDREYPPGAGGAGSVGSVTSVPRQGRETDLTDVTDVGSRARSRVSGAIAATPFDQALLEEAERR